MNKIFKMKESFFVFYFLLSTFAFACPPQGDSKDKNVRALDVLKNRPAGPTPSQIDSKIALEAMLQPASDINRFQPSQGAAITGYVAAVLPGGLESCNCHAKDLAHRDTHIVLVAAMKDAKKENRHVIVEVTPKFHKQLGSTADLRRLVGKRATFTGWMLFDAEHKQNAFNTNPRGGDVWRATAWEIHPVTAIKNSESVPDATGDIAELRALTESVEHKIVIQNAFHLFFIPGRRCHKHARDQLASLLAHRRRDREVDRDRPLRIGGHRGHRFFRRDV